MTDVYDAFGQIVGADPEEIRAFIREEIHGALHTVGREIAKEIVRDFADEIGLADKVAPSPDSRAFTKHGTWGSPYDFNSRNAIRKLDPTFYAILYALLEKADTANAERIEKAWPGFTAEARARYNAPGGLLKGETQ